MRVSRNCILTRAQLSLVFLADRKVCAEPDETPGGDQEGEDGQHLNTGPEIKAAAASGERHFEVLTKNKEDSTKIIQVQFYLTTILASYQIKINFQIELHEI